MEWNLGQADLPREPGVYTVFLKEEARLPIVAIPESRLVYVGRSTNIVGRQIRQHFKTGRTGSSTLRRSIGALLKDEFGLTAIHRGREATEANCRNFRFTPGGEKKLTDWMTTNLGVRVVYAGADYIAVETEVIERLKPVLCLQGWDNPHARAITQLRHECAREARGEPVQETTPLRNARSATTANVRNCVADPVCQ